MQPFFRTSVSWQAPSPKISFQDTILLVGSCFTEHIGNRLRSLHYRALTNPFGIVYNPISIVSCLNRLAKQDAFFTQNELFEYQELWHSWEHHGRFSDVSPERTLTHINDAYTKAAAHLRNTNRLVLTLGTADVFALQTDGRLVANNHKMPAHLFEARRLSIVEITEAAQDCLLRLKSAMPQLEVFLTVSPVRHLRNGAISNQQSKATLILAVETLVANHDFVHYFPAYELLIDDLRDYRFYAEDMVHPSGQAIDYIWNAFSEGIISPQSRVVQAKIERLQTALTHRPLHSNTHAYKVFLTNLLSDINQLCLEYADLDFSEEKTEVEERLALLEQ